MCRQAICLPLCLSVGAVPQLGRDLLGRCGFGLGLGLGFGLGFGLGLGLGLGLGFGLR